MEQVTTIEHSKDDACQQSRASSISQDLMPTVENLFRGIQDHQRVVIFDLNEHFRSAAELVARAADPNACAIISDQLRRTKERVESQTKRS